jgi:O-antigen/teichoic acid export membrane protein
MARFYDQPMLAAMIPVVTFTAVIDGVGSTKVMTARRHLQVGRLEIMTLSEIIVGLIVGVSVAWVYPSVWALVAAVLAASTTKMVFSHVALPGRRDRLGWEWAAFGELFHFGKWIFLGTIATFLATRGDRLVLGKLISMDMLGVYAIAVLIVQVPLGLIQRLSKNIIFPGIARRADLPRDQLKRGVAHYRRRLLLAGAVGVGALVAFGDWPVELLWDPRYDAAGWMTVLLALGLWFQLLEFTIEPALRGIGHPQYSTGSGWVRLTMLAVGWPLGYYYFGLTGVILVTAFQWGLGYSVVVVGLIRHRLWPALDDGLTTSVFLAVVGLGLVARLAFGAELPWG